MRKLVLAFLAVPLLFLAGRWAEPPADNDPLAAYRFLIGDWVGEGSGQPGQGKGQFSFAPDLKGKILVRKHRAEFPASADRPAATHEDLLIVYQGEGAKAAKAIYFDSEGHVINYSPSFSQDGRTLIFVSDATPSSARFRLAYTKGDDGKLQIKFEITPPGKPDSFKTYLEGSARRKEGS